MKSILKLSPSVSNKIAAGEVVTEPVNVVKELLENALDAGADDIDLEIQGAGLKSIKISDNGSGIDQEDAALLFERHATSKLKEAKDLYQISTLGFRGEALASIAAVSRVTVTSRSREQMQGFRLIQYGGNTLSHQSAVRERGTTVQVEDLFYNTPVRENFLQKHGVLEQHITELVRSLAVGQPQIRFKYVVDQAVLFVTHGQGDRTKALYDVFGPEIVQHLIEVEFTIGSMHVSGFISNLDYSRTNRKLQLFFVNGRYVENNGLQEAVQKAYEGLLPLRRYPVCVLWLELPIHQVDVNIHPRKLEVRLREMKEIQDALALALRDRLRHKPIIPKKNSLQTSAEAAQIDFETIRLQDLMQEKIAESDQLYLDIIQNSGDFSMPVLLSELQYIGQFASSFLLYEARNSLYLMDQHAAHEKVLFERFMAAYQSEKLQSQLLMFPIKMTLLPEEVRAFEEGIDHASFGYEAELFSHHEIILRAIPHLFEQEQAKAFLQTLLHIHTEHSNYLKDEIIRQSCKAAVKANHVLAPGESLALLDQLSNLKDPFTCPHGRPIFIEITRKELERRFERI